MPVKRMTSFIIFPPGSRSCSLMQNGGESMVDKTDAERRFSRLPARDPSPQLFVVLEREPGGDDHLDEKGQ